MYSMTWTMLKLSLMYKVWNGLALPHLKVRLTNPMVELRIQSTLNILSTVLNSGSEFGFWLLGVQSKTFQYFCTLYTWASLPLNCKINNTTVLKWEHSTETPFHPTSGICPYLAINVLSCPFSKCFCWRRRVLLQQCLRAFVHEIFLVKICLNLSPIVAGSTSPPPRVMTCKCQRLPTDTTWWLTMIWRFIGWWWWWWWQR